MQIERAQLDAAVGRGLITEAQATALWSEFSAARQDTPQFSFNHLLYYLGGLVAIGGVSVFVTLGWETLGGVGLTLVALAVMTAAAWATRYFVVEQKLVIPAGLMAALVVAATPLAIYGLQRSLGLWADKPTTYRDYHFYVDWRWIVMELGTLAVVITHNAVIADMADRVIHLSDGHIIDIRENRSRRPVRSLAW